MSAGPLLQQNAGLSAYSDRSVKRDRDWKETVLQRPPHQLCQQQYVPQLLPGCTGNWRKTKLVTLLNVYFTLAVLTNGRKSLKMSRSSYPRCLSSYLVAPNPGRII